MRWSMAGWAAAAILLSGCTTNPVPEGYTGPVARAAKAAHIAKDHIT